MWKKKIYWGGCKKHWKKWSKKLKYGFLKKLFHYKCTSCWTYPVIKIRMGDPKKLALQKQMIAQKKALILVFFGAGKAEGVVWSEGRHASLLQKVHFIDFLHLCGRLLTFVFYDISKSPLLSYNLFQGVKLKLIIRAFFWILFVSVLAILLSLSWFESIWVFGLYYQNYFQKLYFYTAQIWIPLDKKEGTSTYIRSSRIKHAACGGSSKSRAFTTVHSAVRRGAAPIRASVVYPTPHAHATELPSAVRVAARLAAVLRSCVHLSKSCMYVELNAEGSWLLLVRKSRSKASLVERSGNP